MSQDNSMKRRAVISFYKTLLKKNRVQQYGPAYKRMLQLEQKYKQETGWLRYRKEELMKTSLDWLNEKDLN